jgi:isopentenyl-diphosphate delta-isomerase
MVMSAEDQRERVVLVDEHDRELGSAEKLSVHADGRLHRAFSVFVFGRKGHLLLQRRAEAKYHSGGLWTNTCCGHPRPFEPVLEAAHRRLREEMGFDCPLQSMLHFVYQSQLENGLCEHELDHVLVGRFDGWPIPNPAEADDWCWVDVRVVMQDARVHPERYTTWFPLALEKLSEHGLLRRPKKQPTPEFQSMIREEEYVVRR